MDEVATLNLDKSVSTDGTNWRFLGTPTHPSWENTQTGHILLIDESTTVEFDYRVRLNHETQLRPWWTITEVDFAGELIPLIEWVLSAPENHLFHRELVVMIPEPFWNDSLPGTSPSDDSSSTA